MSEKALLKAYPPASALVEANAALEAARAAARAALKRVRLACEHPVQFRCDYSPSASGMFRSMPPLLQCARCLLEREEWGGKTSPLGETWNGKKRREPIILPLGREAMMRRRVEGSGGFYDVETSAEPAGDLDALGRATGAHPFT